ncbi:MAG: glycosyltransferase family 4 protein [Nevskiales bacterium]
MRIALVSNTSWSIHNFRRNLIAALKKEGHEVIAIGSYDKYLNYLQTQGISALAVPFTRTSMRLLHELRVVFLLRQVLIKNRIDVVLSFTPKGNIYAALASRGLDIKQIANVSGLGSAFIRINTLSLWILRLYWFAFRKIHHVFFQNEVDREIFMAREIVSPSVTSRLPGSGVDLSYFAAAPFPQHRADEPSFLFLGRLLWGKGVGEYVEASRIIHAEYPKARFYLLGHIEDKESEGPVWPHLQSWLEEDQLEYHGRVDDVRPYIERADCVVLPSVYREGVPRTLLEAAAMGRPVITTDSVGCRDAVNHQVTGFLCKPRDAQDLAAAMRQFIALEPAARERMGRAGREKMEQEFDERRVIQAYLRVIDEMPRQEAR